MRALFGGLLAVLVLTTSTTLAARAQERPPEWVDQELVEVLDTSELLDEWVETSLTAADLDFVRVEGAAYEGLRAELITLLAAERASASEWAERSAGRVTAEQELRLLREDDEHTRALVESVALEIEELDAQRFAREQEIAGVDETRSAIAIMRYMGGRLEPELQSLAAQSEAVKAEVNRAIILVATDESYVAYREGLEAQTESLAERIDRRVRTRNAALAALKEITTDRRRLRDSADELSAEEDAFAAENGAQRTMASELIVKVHQARVTATIPTVGFSLIAFDAYRNAADSMVDEGADCAIDWQTVAGIADVESVHGTLGGRHISANGNLSRPLLGILLDGGEPAPTPNEPGETGESGLIGETVTPGTTVDGAPAGTEADPSGVGASPAPAQGPGANFAQIPDSDGGALDGSATFDRALGPMQFLPSTWLAHGTDGNGDGVADPHNIYDSTTTAAAYLCAVADQIGSGDIARRLLSYNVSQSYVDEVMTIASELRQLSELPG